MSRCRIPPIFRNIFQICGPLFNYDSKRSKPLWKISSDIVEIVFEFLSDVDQACFALSCKRLYVYYLSYTERRGTFSLSALSRTELLPRVQDERWVYCGGCRSLHQYSAWRLPFFVRKCEQPEPSMPGCKAWCYAKNAGKVDICPCSSITFHQKQHPNDYFQSRQETSRTYDGLVHSCIFRHPLAWISVETRAWFDGHTKTFRVENPFTFQPSQEKASRELFRKISFSLSRYQTEYWLKRFLSEADPAFFIGDESSNWYQCHGWNHTGTRPNTFMILLHRDLGGIGWPGKKWEHNCHRQ